MSAAKIVSIIIAYSFFVMGVLPVYAADSSEIFPSGQPPSEQKLRIGVIGSGRMGGTVGRLWVQAGHEVMFASRNPGELRSITQRLGPNASAGTPLEAARFGTVLFLATPHRALEGLGMQLRPGQTGP